jgi:translocation and assembly module TamB
MLVGSQGESAELEGSLRLDGLRVASADLELLLTHFALASSPLLTAKADGRIDVSGPADALSLTGSLSLLDTQVVLPEARDPAYKEIRIIAQSNGRGALTELTETRPQPGFLETASVDVEIVVPSETWVRGRGLNVELAGGVRVRQEPREKSRVSGTVELVRGTYRLQGRVFEVRRGTATFTGASEIDPVIDIEAVHRVSGVRIVALLGGRASDPRLVQLTSEPPMSDNDVVSYLFFGRPASELGQGQSQGVDQVAVKAAAGLAINEFSDLVTQRLPIDTLDIRVGNEGGVTAGVGKYLTRDVFVRYGRGLGRHGEDTTGVEWRLTDELTLESEITSGGAAGADLIWSTDY